MLFRLMDVSKSLTSSTFFFFFHMDVENALRKPKTLYFEHAAPSGVVVPGDVGINHALFKQPIQLHAN